MKPFTIPIKLRYNLFSKSEYKIERQRRLIQLPNDRGSVYKALFCFNDLCELIHNDWAY